MAAAVHHGGGVHGGGGNVMFSPILARTASRASLLGPGPAAGAGPQSAPRASPSILGRGPHPVLPRPKDGILSPKNAPEARGRASKASKKQRKAAKRAPAPSTPSRGHARTPSRAPSGSWRQQGENVPPNADIFADIGVAGAMATPPRLRRSAWRATPSRSPSPAPATGDDAGTWEATGAPESSFSLFAVSPHRVLFG